MADKVRGRNTPSSEEPDDITVPRLLRDIVLKNRTTPMAAVRNLIIYEANEAFARMLGARSAEELRGLDGSILLTPESLISATERFERRARGELMSDAYIYDVIRLDGKRTRIELSAISWPTDPSMTLSVGRDITESERSLEELRSSETLYKTVADTLPVAVTFRDRAGRIVYANKSAASLSGYSEEEVWAGALFTASSEENQKAVMEAMKHGIPITPREIRLTRKDGSQRWILAASQPVLDGNGVCRGLCNAFIDVNDRRMAEDELRQKSEALQKAYEAQRQFLNNITHELRTPMTAVMGYTSMLMEGVSGPLSEEQRSLMQKILANSKILLRLVDNVLKTAKLSRGTAVLTPETCRAWRVVKNAVGLVTPQATQKGLTLTHTEHIAAEKGTYDKEKVRAVVVNLLANAVKFTRTGGVEVMVDFAEAGMGVIIADTGPGIPGDKLPIIFGEFEQLEPSGQSKSSGFGLGLSIAAGMVEVMGATLIVSSAEGVGTAFTLFVPDLKEEACRLI